MEEARKSSPSRRGESSSFMTKRTPSAKRHNPCWVSKRHNEHKAQDDHSFLCGAADRKKVEKSTVKWWSKRWNKLPRRLQTSWQMANSRASQGWEAQSLLNLHRARGGLPFQHQLLQVENRSLSRTPTLRYPSMDIDPWRMICFLSFLNLLMCVDAYDDVLMRNFGA